MEKRNLLSLSSSSPRGLNEPITELTDDDAIKLLEPRWLKCLDCKLKTG